MKTEFQALCEKLNVRIENKFLGEQETDGWRHRSFRCTLRVGRRQLTTQFRQGMGHSSEPTAADVLACLVSDCLTFDDSPTFEDFASSLGYDPDSRKAEAIYKELKRIAPKVRRLCGEHFDALSRAEQ